MRFVLAMVLAGLALPLSASAQAEESEEAPKQAVEQEPASPAEPVPEEPAPPSEPAPKEPSLQLQLDDAGVQVASPPPRTPDGYTHAVAGFVTQRDQRREIERRVRRARIGLGVSVGVLWVGLLMGLGAAAASMCLHEISEGDDPSCPPGWSAPVGATGAVLGVGGLVGTIKSGVLLRKHKRDRDSLRAESRSAEAVEVDSSDDAFLIMVAGKYKSGEWVGVTVFIKHKESGQWANPYIDAADIDTLDQVIRDHKAKLQSGD